LASEQWRQQSFFEAFGRTTFQAAFRGAGKLGETPDTRREWNVQTMDPEILSQESANADARLGQHGHSGAQFERCFRDYFKLAT